MPKYFPGVTHSIVKTPTNAAAMTSLGGAVALVALCFGADEDCIWVIIKKMDGPTSGASAVIPHFATANQVLPAIRGKVANELKLQALLAFDQIKQQFGLKFGKRYKVFENKKVEEILEQQVGA